jgi:hypothetical protein
MIARPLATSPTPVGRGRPLNSMRGGGTGGTGVVLPPPSPPQNLHRDIQQQNRHHSIAQSQDLETDNPDSWFSTSGDLDVPDDIFLSSSPPDEGLMSPHNLPPTSSSHPNNLPPLLSTSPPSYDPSSSSSNSSSLLSARTRGSTVTAPSLVYTEKTLRDIKEGRILKTGAENQVLLFEKNEKGERLIVGATPRGLMEHIFLQTDPNDRSCGYSWQETIDIIVFMHSYIVEDSKKLMKKLLNFLKATEKKLFRSRAREEQRSGGTVLSPAGLKTLEEVKHGTRVIQVCIANFIKQWFKIDSDWTYGKHGRPRVRGRGRGRRRS